jgi:hypothetical protein
MNSKTKTEMEEKVGVVQDTEDRTGVSVMEVLKAKPEALKQFNKMLRSVMKQEAPIESIFLKGGKSSIYEMIKTALGNSDGAYFHIGGVGAYVENSDEGVIEGVSALYTVVKEAHKKGYYQDNAPFYFKNGNVMFDKWALYVDFEKGRV